MRVVTIAASALTLILAGCASTRVATTGSPLAEPLCKAGEAPVATLVYWGTAWRPEQKEPQRREAAAARGLHEFLHGTDCLAVQAVRQLPANRVPPSDEELLRLAAATDPVSQRVLLVQVRELGPRLRIGIPTVVEGETEVVLDLRVIDTTSSRALAGMQTAWRNGGPFVIKGVKSLEQDMRAALQQALMSPAPAR